jgi:hypothetical protein
MIGFINKILFLLEKMKHRSNVECERYYILTRFSEYLQKDDQSLRVELSKLKAIKEPTPETKKRIMELDVEVTEIMQYRAMISKSDEKIKELTKLVEATKEFLWK